MIGWNYDSIIVRPKSIAIDAGLQNHISMLSLCQLAIPIVTGIPSCHSNGSKHKTFSFHCITSSGNDEDDKIFISFIKKDSWSRANITSLNRSIVTVRYTYQSAGKARILSSASEDELSHGFVATGQLTIAIGPITEPWTQLILQNLVSVWCH